MTFTKEKPENKIFGKNATRVLSFRVPENQFETIKTIVKGYIDSYSENDHKKIKTIHDGIKEIISIYLDVDDCLKYRTNEEIILIARKTGVPKEKTLSISKYYAILKRHNLDLIDDLITKFPIERKPKQETKNFKKLESKDSN